MKLGKGFAGGGPLLLKGCYLELIPGRTPAHILVACLAQRDAKNTSGGFH